MKVQVFASAERTNNGEILLKIKDVDFEDFDCKAYCKICGKVQRVGLIVRVWAKDLIIYCSNCFTNIKTVSLEDVVKILTKKGGVNVSGGDL